VVSFQIRVLNIIWFNVSYPSFNKLSDDGSKECALYILIKDKDTYNKAIRNNLILMLPC
jgi:hypothetical protein